MATKDPQGRIIGTTLTAADAAELVVRMVPKVEDGKVVLDKDGNPVAVEAPVKANEVQSFADYGDRVVVVTTSGEKLEGKKPEGKKKAEK